MRNSRLLLSVLFVVLFSAPRVYAQDESVPPFAVGLRANPDGAGVVAKYFFVETVSIEAMLNGSSGSYYQNGPSTTFVGLLEYNFIFNDPAWRIFIGPGAHVGSSKPYADNNTPRQAVYGLDAIAGIEYVFYEVPIGLSLDVKPAINFINGVTEFPANTFGLGVRYYFGDTHKRRMVHPQDGMR